MLFETPAALLLGPAAFPFTDPDTAMRKSLYLLPLPLAACFGPPPPAIEAAAVAEAAALASAAAEAEAEAIAQPAIVYPETRRTDLVEQHFGLRVADPYRWLENDVRTDAEVASWVEAQNRVSSAFLSRLPEVDAFKALLTRLYDYERFDIPEEAGGRYFYTRNSGLQNQAPLYVRDGLNGEQRLLIDPNTWSADNATALAGWVPSDDGKRMLYAVQEGGSDWRTVKVLDVDSGQVLADEVEWVKYSNLAWAKDGSGFYYSRFPEPAAGEEFQSTTENQAIYFHKLGTPQSADRLVYADPERPKLGHFAQVSSDGRWLIVTTSVGTDEAYEIRLIDLTRRDAPPIVMVGEATNNWIYLGNVGTSFYWLTDKDAPLGRIVVTDPIRRIAMREVVAEDAATLRDAAIVGDKLIGEYLKDAKSEVRRFSLDGQPMGTVAMPGIGASGGFDINQDSSEAFFLFQSFNVPGAIYRYDSASNQVTPFAQPELSFDPSQFSVEQRFFASKDGTRVPMFVMRRKDLPEGPQPTLLYGYGGFNAAELPRFQPKWLAWVQAGGVLAVANIRGGGEYGKEWHDAGRLANKQNVFDDFIAAGEYLIASGATTREQLAIEGRSNGGLLVGAVLNQRPDLFAAALPTVGVMDMLRFNQFTAGRYWVDDYGDPGVAADFHVLRAYSPYHNIRTDVDYPPTLTTTADTDDRVTPGHSFKYAAALQHADPDGRPHLIRIETRAGHGSGKPTDKQIDEYADMYGFIAHFTGLTPAAR